MAVELKKGQKVNLIKADAAPTGEISVNLNWSQPDRRGFLFQRKKGAIDLDLGCLYELRGGNKGLVQALGNCFGNLNDVPYIALDGDDRTGAVEGGENLRINRRMVKEIRRILIYTFIYEGAANWREARGVVTVKCPGSEDVIVRIDEYGSSQGTCAIAMLENAGDDTFTVEKIVRFFGDNAQMDRAFNWGLNWGPGRK